MKMCMVILHVLYKLVAFYVQHRNKHNSVCACVSIKIVIQLSVLMYSGK